MSNSEQQPDFLAQFSEHDKEAILRLSRALTKGEVKIPDSDVADAFVKTTIEQANKLEAFQQQSQELAPRDSSINEIEARPEKSVAKPAAPQINRNQLQQQVFNSRLPEGVDLDANQQEARPDLQTQKGLPGNRGQSAPKTKKELTSAVAKSMQMMRGFINEMEKSPQMDGDIQGLSKLKNALMQAEKQLEEINKQQEQKVQQEHEIAEKAEEKKSTLSKELKKHLDGIGDMWAEFMGWPKTDKLEEVEQKKEAGGEKKTASKEHANEVDLTVDAKAKNMIKGLTSTKSESLGSLSAPQTPSIGLESVRQQKAESKSSSGYFPGDPRGRH